MKRYTSLCALLKDVIFGCPEQKQQERVDKAVEAHAEAIGDLQYARTMRAGRENRSRYQVVGLRQREGKGTGLR